MHQANSGSHCHLGFTRPFSLAQLDSRGFPRLDELQSPVKARPRQMRSQEHRKVLTLSIQHLGDIKVFFSHFKSVVQVGDWIILGEQG